MAPQRLTTLVDQLREIDPQHLSAVLTWHRRLETAPASELKRSAPNETAAHAPSRRRLKVMQQMSSATMSQAVIACGEPSQLGVGKVP
jgi:hypothetical protein